MTHIYLIRHAQTDSNSNPICISGRSNHVKINEIGHKQSIFLEKYLALSKNEIDAMYVSPAHRTIETSHYVVRGLSYLGHIIIDDRLQEIDQGDWTGQNRNDIYTIDTLTAIRNNPLSFTPPNGESINIVGDRMNELLDEIVEKYPHGSVRIIGHGVAIASTIMKRFGITGSTIKQFPHSNTGITALYYDSNPTAIVSWRMLSYNNDSHLPAEYRTIQLV